MVKKGTQKRRSQRRSAPHHLRASAELSFLTQQYLFRAVGGPHDSCSIQTSVRGLLPLPLPRLIHGFLPLEQRTTANIELVVVLRAT